MIDRVLKRVEYSVVRVHINKVSVSGNGSGPLEVEIGLSKIVVVRSRIARAGNQHHFRIVGRHAGSAAECADIGQVDIRLPHDGNPLTASIKPIRVQTIQVVNRGEVRGSQEVVSRHSGRELR